MKKRSFLFIGALLVSPSMADTNQTVTLSRGSTISDILWNNGYSPLYGPGNFLEQALSLNGLSLASARSLRPGARIILPPQYRPLNLMPSKVNLSQKKRPSPPHEPLSYYLSLENRFLTYKDEDNNQAILEAPINARVGANYRHRANQSSFLWADLFYDYQSYKAPIGTSISKSVFQSLGLELGAGVLLYGVEFAMGIGRELWAAPVSTAMSEVEMGEQYAEYLIPSLKAGIVGDLYGKAYVKSFVPREGKDFEIRHSQLYGAEVSWLRDKREFSFYLLRGARKTKLLTEDFDSLGLRLRLFLDL